MGRLTARDNILNHAQAHNRPHPGPSLCGSVKPAWVSFFFFWPNVSRSLLSSPTESFHAGNAVNSTPAPEPPQLMGSLDTNQEGCWGREALSLRSPGREGSSRAGKQSPCRPPGAASAVDTDPGPRPPTGVPGLSLPLPRRCGAVSRCNAPLGVH